MTINRVVSRAVEASFSATPSVSVDVGTGAHRYIRAWLGYVGQTTNTPTSMTVGTDTLTTVGAEQTGPGGLSNKWRLFEGLLTVTGTQAVAGVFTGPADSGFSVLVFQVYQGTTGALTFGTPVFSKPEGGSSASRSSTVTPTTTSDSVAMLGYATDTTNIAADSPATLSGDMGLVRAFSAMRDGAASSTVISVTFTGAHSSEIAAYSITEAAGGGSSIAAISNYYRMMRSA